MRLIAFTEFALTLYDLLWRRRKGGFLSRLRRAEAHLRLGRPGRALELLDELEASEPDSNGWTSGGPRDDVD
jgi:hypothetical protein